MKNIIIFIAGMVTGIVCLLAGVWYNEEQAKFGGWTSGGFYDGED